MVYKTRAVIAHDSCVLALTVKRFDACLLYATALRVIHHAILHEVECSIDEENAEIINDTIDKGGRIISVGTTSTRTLESMAGMPLQPFKGEGVPAKRFRVRSGETSTGIFIYPGYEFRIVDALITNFHLPKSTLLMLISALYDREKILEVYQEAVQEEYRFFSYGDAMFIE
jgi:S-adenosylmethionine:tRNA ribosyltransferase-isomerase